VTDLTSVASVKAQLGINGTADDALLAVLVTAYSAWVETYLGRKLLSTTHSITRSGRGQRQIQLPQWPVTAISSLMIDGRAIPLQTSFGGYGYRFTDRAITLDVMLFSPGIDNVTVNFTAGHLAVPPDIAQAVNELVALHYRRRDTIDLASKSLAGETIAFVTKAMPDAVRQVLNQYRAVVPL
jgi:uncharacterized phiE125 gp8 family phage protein